jgi:uncharacterized protein (DUF1778 family)
MERVMPRAAISENSRMSLRLRPVDKAVIMRGSALARTDMTEFVVRTAVQAAQELIEQSEHVMLSKRDSLMILDLLDNPPPANAKMIAAINALPKLP